MNEALSPDRVEAPGDFFVTGGTLRLDAPSYIERKADQDLYDGLIAGEFCYTLTSRQMGKSSLMIRTTARLQENGVSVVLLDLTALGRNLVEEQWYSGLLAHIGRQLDLEGDIEAYWDAHERLSPLQRWRDILERVVLPRCPGPLVIFIDEIDAVRSLPFSTDEFFAAIRECYNHRARDPEFRRLTFCLLGVASPTDLIRDTGTTPFNIGRRIDLTDFTESEIEPLVRGLVGKGPPAKAMLRRVLHWTGGHPYLTQRLCQAAAANPSVVGPAGIDRLCESLFLSRRAREQDDNLIFVRDRILRSEADSASLLDLYLHVRNHRRVRDDDVDPLVSILRLSGIVRAIEGYLWVRNRIYYRVFDREWALSNMPDAEVRRQRAAFRRGVIRTALAASVILTMMAALAIVALFEARRAERSARAEQAQRKVTQRLLYVADIRLAARAWEDKNPDLTLELLERHLPRPGEEDLRGFEWRYLMRQYRQSAPKSILKGIRGEAWAVAFSPDGGRVAYGGDDGTLRIWDATTRKIVGAFPGETSRIWAAAFSPDGRYVASAHNQQVEVWHLATGRKTSDWKSASTGAVNAVTFSPDGRLLACGADDGTARIREWPSGKLLKVIPLSPGRGIVWWVAFSPDNRSLAVTRSSGGVSVHDRTTWKETAVLRAPSKWFRTAIYSPNGRYLAVAGDELYLYDLYAGRRVVTLKDHDGAVYAAAFSPDSRRLASVGQDRVIRFWDVVSKRHLGVRRAHDRPIYSAVFSPDGRRLATAGADGLVKLWDPFPVPMERSLRGHESFIWSMNFSRDGRLLASGGDTDNTVRLWNPATGRPLAVLSGNASLVREAALSPDGRRLAATTGIGFVYLWDVPGRRVLGTLSGHGGCVACAAFSPDGRLLATGCYDARLRLWNPVNRKLLATLKSHGGEIWKLGFSPDGRTLATASVDGTVRLWDVPARREIRCLRGHNGPVRALAFSPDGRILASGGDDCRILLWQVPEGRRPAVLPGHTGNVNSLAFSRDGRTLASSGAGDDRVKLWSVGARQVAMDFPAHPKGTSAVAFTPDGAALVSGGDDHAIRIWRTTPSPRQPLPRVGTPPPEYLNALPAKRWPVPLKAIPVTPRSRGLRVSHYRWADPNSIPDRSPAPSRRILSRAVPLIDFDASRPSPNPGPAGRRYQSCWEGYLRAPVSGPYLLELVTNDGFQLEVDGDRLISRWTTKEFNSFDTRSVAALILSAGWHRLRVSWYPRTDKGGIRLRWVTPSEPTVHVVPTRYLGRD